MDKENTVCTCNGPSFSLKREANPAIYNSMYETGGHFANDKLVSERQILHDSTLFRYLK